MRSTRYLDYHKCIEDDFALFNPVTEQSRNGLERLKEGNVLYCIDNEQFSDVVLYGEDDNDDNQRLSIIMMPCIQDLERDICVNRTLEETQAYLSQANLMLYVNSERFDSSKYHEDKIARESRVINQQLSVKEPMFIDSHI